MMKKRILDCFAHETKLKICARIDIYHLQEEYIGIFEKYFKEICRKSKIILSFSLSFRQTLKVFMKNIPQVYLSRVYFY